MSTIGGPAANGETRTIAVIVGAGASIASGAPSTDELLETVLASFPAERVFEDLRGNRTVERVPLAGLLREYLAQFGNGEVNFEVVMACLEEMMSYGMPGRAVQSFTQARSEFETVLDAGVLQAAYSGAIRALLRAFLSNVPRTNGQIVAAQSLTRFIQLLSNNARIVLSTLNYDPLLDNACQGLMVSHQLAGVSLNSTPCCGVNGRTRNIYSCTCTAAFGLGFVHYRLVRRSTVRRAGTILIEPSRSRFGISQ